MTMRLETSTAGYGSTDARSLLDGDSLAGVDGVSNKNSTKSYTAAFVIVCALAAGALVGIQSTKENISSSHLYQDLSTEAKELWGNGQDTHSDGRVNNGKTQFIAVNEHTRWTPVEHPWEHLVEPHKTTTFEVLDPSKDEDVMYEWKIGGNSYEGESIEHTFTEAGISHVVELITYEGGNPVLHETSEMLCKYVRREIRNLTSHERTQFFEAMSVVYNTSTSRGKHLYGAEFKGIEYFIRKHLYGAASKDCDHWHDGAGIMSHHIGFTYEFETSLQAVRPAVSVPYWEFSLDAQMFGGDWQNSPIFKDSWFGEPSPDNDDHALDSGRWRDLSIMTDAWDYSPITNPYGLLRSPWNTNPVPKLTRYKSINGLSMYESFPSCFDIWRCFQSLTASDMNSCLNGYTHGPVHIMIGGSWPPGTNGEQPPIVNDFGYWKVFLLLAKNLWRHGYTECPEFCGKDTPVEFCQCKVASWAVEGQTSYDILTEKTGLMSWIDLYSEQIFWDEPTSQYVIDNYTKAETLKTWDLILASLGNPGHNGEMYTSAAPYDPLFWVLHPTADRLMQYRRYLGMNGTKAFNQTWGYSHDPMAPSDTGVICDWSDVQDKEHKLPVCHVGECSGHAKSDLLPFTIAGKTFTNGEFYQFMRPFNPNTPYMYDNFKWNHCEDYGIHIN